MAHGVNATAHGMLVFRPCWQRATPDWGTEVHSSVSSLISWADFPGPP